MATGPNSTHAPISYPPAMLALAFLTPAVASCSVSQTPTEEGVDVAITAGPGSIHCRTITLTASSPLVVEARVRTREERRYRLRRDHVAAFPGGGSVIAAPALRDGDTIEISVATDAEDLTVALVALPSPMPRGTWIDETRTFILDDRHPAWGFADPRLASTEVVLHMRVDADAPPQILPLPVGATILDAGGLVPIPGALQLPPGTNTTVRYSIPGALPHGAVDVPPGSFTLACAACQGWEMPGAQPSGDARRLDLPAGGTARWRVGSTRDGDVVIPDAVMFRSGLAWRFARASLPEPAVPVHLKGLRDRREMLEALFLEAQALTRASLPGADPLRPRALNRAWKSDWATDVERGLILHRMLGQEKIVSDWVLVGERGEPGTLTGYDAMLLRAKIGDAVIWLDPACRACVVGEVSPRWMGRITADGEEVPRGPGRLTRTTTLLAGTYAIVVTAEGDAVRWLREAVENADPEQHAVRLAAWVGARGAQVTSVEGLNRDVATIRLVATAPPRNPFEDGPVPFLGGFEDTLTVAQ